MAILVSSCVSNLTTSDNSLSSPVPVSADERVIAERVYALVNNEREVAGKKMLRGHHGLNHLDDRRLPDERLGTARPLRARSPHRGSCARCC